MPKRTLVEQLDNRKKLLMEYLNQLGCSCNSTANSGFNTKLKPVQKKAK